MIKLSELKDTHRSRPQVKRLGRGVGSGKGKTCGKGTKGAKSRRGYKRRAGAEGGQLPLYRKIPIRGFSRGRFQKEVIGINVGLLDKYFNDRETVSNETLKEKGLIPLKRVVKVKILGNGDLKKNLSIETHSVSEEAKNKITKAQGTIKLLAK